MLWIKAFHLVAVVSWFAGLFYLPRLFVYHVEASDQTSRDRFKIMERRLYFGIMLPAMIISVVLGIVLLKMNWDYYRTQGWMHAKLTLAFLLIGYHHVCGAYLKKFKRDENTKSSRFFRWFNEIPVVFLILISVLVIVRPF